MVAELLGCSLAELAERISGWEYRQWVELLQERHGGGGRGQIRHETPHEIEAFFRAWAES